MNIPIKIYLYTILISIFIVLGISFYLYFSINTSYFHKTYIIWYTIILEINLIHLYFIMNFYEKNKNKKGPKGPKGDVGPKGFKGVSEKCSSCGPSIDAIFSGNINDKGENISNRSNVYGGKCKFPFVHNYQYQYKCLKDNPPDEEENDANIHGWCATELNEKNEVTKYGYCNENESIQDKLNKEKQYLDNRAEYINNNYGILDVDIVNGNTETEAKKKCDKLGENYNIVKNKDGIEQDLNEGVDGKFTYMCYKQGYGNLGIGDLKIYNNNENKFNTITDENNVSTKYNLIDVDLNQGSKITGQDLYLYKSSINKNFIKNLVLSKDTCDDEYYTITNDKNELANFNEPDIDNKIILCGKRKHTLDSINMAFVYHTGTLYIFRNNDFYKMSKVTSQNYINVLDDYPKKISERWFSGTNCSKYNDNSSCNQQEKCMWNDPENEEDNGKCEHMNFSAAFTYDYDKKTYFFRGSKIYKYDNKNMKVESGFPKNIGDVFKGVPDNIDAVFTWKKDGSTYFFKGPLYYKFNDKTQKIESGYPKKTKDRWPGIPTVIDAIFTLNTSLDNKGDNFPTYIISGGYSYYIDSVTDKVINKKTIDERFKGLFEAYIEQKEKELK